MHGIVTKLLFKIPVFRYVMKEKNSSLRQVLRFPERGNFQGKMDNLTRGRSKRYLSISKWFVIEKIFPVITPTPVYHRKYTIYVHIYKFSCWTVQKGGKRLVNILYYPLGINNDNPVVHAVQYILKVVSRYGRFFYRHSHILQGSCKISDLVPMIEGDIDVKFSLPDFFNQSGKDIHRFGYSVRNSVGGKEYEQEKDRSHEKQKPKV